MNKKTLNLKLLPNYYKKISFGILAVSVLMLVLNKVFLKEVDKEIIREIFKVGVLISLSMLAMSKDKEEDELTIKIRMNSYAISFLFGASYLIVEPFINLFFDHSFLFDMDAYQLILTMFIFYFISFSSYKNSR